MSNNRIKPIDRLWLLMTPDKKEIKNVYVYAIFAGLISLSLPLGIQAIVNLIQGGQISTSWIILVVMVILGIAVNGVLQVFQLRITENLQQKIFTRAAFEFAYRIPKVKLEELYKKYAPELANRFFDTLTVQKGLSKILIDFSSASLQIIFGLLLLSFYHPFFIIFSLILIVLVYIIMRYTAPRGLATSLVESKYKYQVAHWLEEIARTNITFKLSGNSSIPLKRINEYTNHYINGRESHFKILVQQYSLLILFKIIVATGLLAIGGILVFEQQMNIGQFVGAEIVILIVLASVEKLILSMETIYDVLTGLEKIGEFTDMELEQSMGTKLDNVEIQEGLSIKIKDLFFSYPTQKEDILRGLNVSIKSGEKIMITGANTSGKSTLLSLLSGLYNPQKGNVSFNGLPLRNLDMDSIRLLIGNSIEAEALFEGTIFENISLGRPNATYENVRWAAEKMGLTDFIDQQAFGFEAVLDPEGKRLPSSIIQKMILARSIAHKPRLVLLKDAFKFINENERNEIITFLTDISNTWTLIIVSSSIDVAKHCDRVLIMSEGVIANSGTFMEMEKFIKTKNNKNA